MTLAFAPQPPILAPTSDGRQFPVRRVFCIGRNYAAHAREMGKDPEREAPFYFTKWAETVVPSGSTIAYPPLTSNYQFEAELVVAIGKGGRNITADAAREHVWGYAAGLDMTRRDLQFEARDKGRPWDIGKNVEQSSPLGLIHPASEVGPLSKRSIRLGVNGVGTTAPSPQSCCCRDPPLDLWRLCSSPRSISPLTPPPRCTIRRHEITLAGRASGIKTRTWPQLWTFGRYPNYPQDN